MKIEGIQALSVFSGHICPPPPPLGLKFNFYSHKRVNSKTSSLTARKKVVKLRTKLSVVTFIQEDFPANFLHHNIPRINGSSATHQCGQNSVSGKNVGIRVAFGQFSDNRIVGGCHGMNDSINFPQWPFILYVDLLWKNHVRNYQFEQNATM